MGREENIRLLETRHSVEILLIAIDNHIDSANDPNNPNENGWFSQSVLYYNEKGNPDHARYNVVKKLIDAKLLEQTNGKFRRDYLVRLTDNGFKIAYHLLASIGLMENA